MKESARTTSNTMDFEADSGEFCEVVSDLEHLDTEMSHREEGKTRFGHVVCDIYHGWEVEGLKYTDLAQSGVWVGGRKTSFNGW